VAIRTASTALSPRVEERSVGEGTPPILPSRTARRTLGPVRRFPWLTATVALVTAAGLVVQELVPGTLSGLERSPAATWDEPWRWVTALLTQDGWLVGGLFNIGALVLAGIAVEQVVAPRVWLTAYVGSGLVGQVVGHYWQPVGAGNSVAVCGLVGLLAVLLAGGLVDGALPRLVPPVWTGALAAAAWWPLVVVGSAVAMLVNGPLRERPWSRRLAGTFCVAATLVLLASRDIHGGALAVALVVSTVAVRVGAIDIL
jgi:rhomboid protease GluP